MSFKLGLKHNILRKIENFVIGVAERRIAMRPEHKKVEFYLMDTFEIFHFLPIYKALIESGFEANFVCEPPDINVVHKWFDYDTAIKILKDLGVKYTLKADEYSRISFTTQHLAVLSKYHGIKINLNYGCGFNKTNFGNTPESTKGFDYKFVHGKYMAKIAAKVLKRNQIKIVGYPKHDEYFKNLPNKNDIKEKLGICTDKPILVYFPTWDEDSSIQKFGDEVNKLRDKFFVVTKAHHCTFRLEDKKCDLDKLYNISDLLLEGNSKFSDAAAIADIALIDGKSGSSCEVPYLNNDLPIVYLSPRENLKEFYKDEIFEFGVFINNPKELEKTVSNVFENDKFIKKRKRLIEFYLGKNDGKSTERTIKVLRDILK